MFLRRILQPHPTSPTSKIVPGTSRTGPEDEDEERQIQTAFSPTPSPPACHLARRARAGGALPSSVRRRRLLASAARMGAWGRRGGAFGVAALGGDKLIGLSIDLEELHSASLALEARVDEALAGR